MAGGYDPSLAPDAYEPCAPIEFLVRGEGELTFRELLRALESGADPGHDRRAVVPARRRVRAQPEPAGRVAQVGRARSCPIAARACSAATRVLGRQADVVETSRGCTYDCSFCSIIEMRGRNFHPYPIERVLADIADSRSHGARAIFLVDDNITLDVRRFEALCEAIIESGLSDVDYVVQAMTSPLAEHGATAGAADAPRRFPLRVPRHRERARVGSRVPEGRRQEHASPRAGRRSATRPITAIEHLHRHGLYVVGGLIVGNPDDTRESIEANLEFARRYVDWPYIQHPTPYPRTPMTDDFQAPQPDRRRGRRALRRHHGRGRHRAPAALEKSSSCAGAPSAG